MPKSKTRLALKIHLLRQNVNTVKFLFQNFPLKHQKQIELNKYTIYYYQKSVTKNTHIDI
jgi:hypothetical protein